MYTHVLFIVLNKAQETYLTTPTYLNKRHDYRSQHSYVVVVSSNLGPATASFERLSSSAQSQKRSRNNILRQAANIPLNLLHLKFKTYLTLPFSFRNNWRTDLYQLGKEPYKHLGHTWVYTSVHVAFVTADPVPISLTVQLLKSFAWITLLTLLLSRNKIFLNRYMGVCILDTSVSTPKLLPNVHL